jgi:hypothetical protein
MGRYFLPEARYAPFPSNPKIAIPRHPSQIINHEPKRIAPAPVKRVDMGREEEIVRDEGGRRVEYVGMGMFKPDKADRGGSLGLTEMGKETIVGSGKNGVAVEKIGEEKIAMEDDGGKDEDEGKRRLRSSSGRRKHI